MARRSSFLKRSRSPWKNRIVGNGEVSPDTLVAHDKNWRTHPAAQQAALVGAINELGFLRSVTVNQRTGRILDGHLRVKAALQTGQKTIPVEYVDLSEDEEKLALLTLDPLSTMAETDSNILEGLLREVQTDSQAVADLLTSLAEENKVLEELDEEENKVLEELDEEADDEETEINEQFNILIECESEEQQAELLERLAAEGLNCRSLIS